MSGEGRWAETLGLEPEDLPVLLRMGAAAFLLNAGAVLAWSALMGRFVGRLGAGRMPDIYVAVNVVTILLYLSLASRPPRAAASGPARPAILASAGLVLLVVLPSGRFPAVVFGSFLLSWLYLVVFELEFWSWMASLLPLREAKRLTPLVGGVGTSGRIAGALLATDPLGWTSISALLLTAAVLGAAALPFLRAAERVVAAQDAAAVSTSASAVTPVASPGLSRAAGRVARSPLLQRVVLLCFAAGFFKGTADYPLAVLAKQRLGFEEELAAFFGGLGAAVNATAVLLQLMGTGPLLAKLPLRRTVLGFPLAVTLASGLGGLLPIFWVATGVRFVQRLGNRALHTPLVVTLMNPFPSPGGRPVRALAMGVSTAAGMLAAGIGLRILGEGTGPLPGVYLGMAVVGGAACLAARGADDAYVGALVSASGRSVTAGAGTGSRTPREAATRALLGLEDPEIRHALEESLAAASGDAFSRRLAEALTEVPEHGALRALRQLAPIQGCEGLAEELTRTLVEGGSSRLAGQAARVTASVGSRRLDRVFASRLASEPDGPARVWLAGAVLRRGRRAEELRTATRVLRAALGAPEVARRVAALEVLGGLGLPIFGDALLAGLEDSDPVVRLGAARALAKARLPGTLEAVERARAGLDGGGLADALDAAAERIRDHALEEVQGVLEGLPLEERRRVARGLKDLSLGGDLSLAVRLMQLSSAPVRAAVLDLLREEGRSQVVEALASLDEEGLPAEAYAALLRQTEEGGGEVLWTALDVLLVRRRHEEAILDFVARQLEGAPAPRARLERACAGLGLLAQDRGAFLEALERAGDRDRRVASAARELLTTALPAGRGRRKLLAALDELVPPGGAP